MVGSGAGTSKIPNLQIDKYAVEAGDMVCVQAHPGAPMIAGQITKCGRDPMNPYCWEITVEPSCDIDNLKSVDVIITKTPAS